MGKVRQIINFYLTGFNSMTIGKTLWIIIFIKLVILFLILKLFFFKPALKDYKTDEDKSNKVIENLISK
ncbi:MAG: DUF4492 domain-containing protein [Bacteroidales bacterium]